MITISAIIGFLLLLVVCSATSCQAFLKRYGDYSGECLVRSNRRAIKIVRTSLVLLFVGPIVMGMVVAHLVGPVQRALISFFIMTLMSFAAVFWTFRRIEKKTRDEIALREAGRKI